jgi:succinate dehydrogenase flavin-adding protein (antitoxin of CptAB toxin-antitoxin module)
MAKPQPMQPIYLDGEVARFQQNAIVRWLLDWSSNRGMNMNDLAMMPFEKADREQFAQLIGYSVQGFSELQYASDEAVEKAIAAAEQLAKPNNRKRKPK